MALSKNLRKYLNLLWQSSLFWFLAFFIFFIIRFTGLKSTLETKDPTFEFTLLRKLEYAFIIGVPLGVIYSLIEFFFEKYLSKRTSIIIQLITKTVIYFIALIILFTFVRWFFQYENNIEEEIERGWWRLNVSFWIGVLFFLLASSIFSFIKIAIEKFGKKNFMKMLLGTYKKPKEEQRIFMFLDLKDSTSIAEKLGHFKYSEFIQECFYDLNEVVPKHEAEIYQYVGDEAVLTWDYKKGLANNNCVSLYFSFQERLLSKSEFYNDKFGVTPKFKAGLHGGKLIVAEVGTIKKELAYHGDVINTAARIQSLCNDYNQSLIASETILNNLTSNPVVNSIELGEISLKGKENRLNLFGFSS